MESLGVEQPTAQGHSFEVHRRTILTKLYQFCVHVSALILECFTCAQNCAIPFDSLRHNVPGALGPGSTLSLAYCKAKVYEEKVYKG